MNAREMFEQLGYGVYRHKDSIVCFRQDENTNFIYEIVFDLVDEIYTTKSFGIVVSQDSTIPVDLMLHKALHQQMKELGWIK